MKNIFRFLFPLFLIVAVSSCAKKADIDNLQEQIDNLKTGQIATIEQQMTNIQSSIKTLVATDTQFSSFISDLRQETSGIKADLSSKEKALGDKIDILKKYVDDELGKNRDWASATFATLKQYQSLLAELAGIRQSISSLDANLKAKIDSSIVASESSMKGWVSEQLSGYYTITQMDAKLKALADSNAVVKQSMSELAEALAKAKTDLTAAYTKAIADAIADHNGAITTKIAADIKTATDALQAQIDALDLRIAALEGMIQSISVIPAFSDGKLVVSSTGILTIDCVIYPISSVKGLSEDNFKVLVASVLTKSAPVTGIPASSVQIDEAKGAVKVKADISSVLPAGEGETLMAAVNVSAGKTDYASSFTPTVFTVLEPVDLGLSVEWASCNLGAGTPDDFGGYYQWAGLDDVADKRICLDWNNCPYHTGDDSSTGWTKYVSSFKPTYWSGPGSPDDKSVLDPEDDVASVKMGGRWRMPLNDEFEELCAKCTWTWITLNGVDGYKVQSNVTGFTDNWIFLPAGGYREGNTLGGDGYGHFWTSFTEYYTSSARTFYFRGGYMNARDYADRFLGQSVRPVLPVLVSSVTLDKYQLVLDKGDIGQLSVTVHPERTKFKNVSWKSSNTSVATVDNTGKVTAISKGSATVTVTSENGPYAAACKVTVNELPEGPVDLGLSVKWASCNLGANVPEGSGDYFAWGATESLHEHGYALEDPQYHWIQAFGYCWMNAPFNGGYDDFEEPYWNEHKSECSDANGNLRLEYDPARVILGGKWRLPTKAEFDELLDESNCTWTWKTVNGKTGYMVQSKKPDYSDGRIFLPGFGCRFDQRLNDPEFNQGHYWLSTLVPDEPYYAWHFYFTKKTYHLSGANRYLGLTVRPVTE